MQRLAFKMKLNKGQKEAYKKRHDDIWFELKALLKENGVCEYSIFLMKKHTVYLHFKKYRVNMVLRT